MRILYPVRLDGFFAQAGQSVVERALLAELLARGVAIRLVAFGHATQQERVAREVSARHPSAALEILKPDAAETEAVLANVDALLLHSLPNEDIARWLNRVWPMVAVPIVQYVHSLLLAPFEQVMWPQLWSRWTGWPPARIVAPSESTAARMRTLAPEARRRGGRLPSVAVIPHGVDAEALRRADRADARARLHVGKPEIVVLSIGRLTPQKAAYTQLVLAFHDARRLATRAQRPVLLLAGWVAGHDKRYVALLARHARRLGIADRVRIVEDFDEAEKATLYAAGDVFVSLANDPQESFGVALLEAMAVGLPVLATCWDGYPETLTTAYEAHMVPTIASHALARALDWTSAGEACAPAFYSASSGLATMIADRMLRVRLGTEGRRIADAHSWARAAEALVRLLEQLAGEQRSADAGPGAASAPPVSMVDGLASMYLDDDPRLRIPSMPPSGRRRRQALWIAARPILPPPPRAPAGDSPAWMSRGPRRGRRDVLGAATAAGQAGVPASSLRAKTGLGEAEADLLLLRLIRYGLLDVMREPQAVYPVRHAS